MTTGMRPQRRTKTDMWRWSTRGGSTASSPALGWARHLQTYSSPMTSSPSTPTRHRTTARCTIAYRRDAGALSGATTSHSTSDVGGVASAQDMQAAIEVSLAPPPPQAMEAEEVEEWTEPEWPPQDMHVVRHFHRRSRGFPTVATTIAADHM